MGLVPRQSSSGGKSVLGEITKRGDEYLRTLLIQGAKSAVFTVHRRRDVSTFLRSHRDCLYCGVLAISRARSLDRSCTLRVIWRWDMCSDSTVASSRIRRSRAA
jgi:hypothetical protein